MPLFLEELDLYIIVDAKVESQKLVQVPAELVVLNGRHNTHQPGVVEKIVRHFVQVELQLHAYTKINWMNTWYLGGG